MKRLLALCGLLAGGCAATVEAPPTALPELRPGFVAGYLQPAQLPDSSVLLPGPPAMGSPGQAADEAIHRATRKLRDTPRWELAKGDADLKFPRAAGIFQCALGVAISEQSTPYLYNLLQRMRMDSGRATSKAKNVYRRQRPQAVTGDVACEGRGQSSDSYPSGHGSIGWAWALALAEIAPDRADAILARGLEHGNNRVACGMHWMSDVEAGRLVGAATLARLHAEPTFVAQLAQAKREIEAARAQSKPPQGCEEEARALAIPVK
jgi:acid phosphatase (class A)